MHEIEQTTIHDHPMQLSFSDIEMSFTDIQNYVLHFVHAEREQIVMLKTKSQLNKC